jgi:putative hydrolase of the HAD superfamily
MTIGKGMENISAVIFDLDDTLIDRRRTFSLYCEYLIDNFLKNKISLNERENVLVLLKEMDKNGYESRDIFYKKIIDTWNLEYTVEDFEQDWIERFDKYSVSAYRLMDTLEYLNKKYKLAIITNGLSYMQNKKIDAVNIREYFEEIIISGDIGIRKPEKEIFLLCCNRLKVEPSEAVYIGDNYEIDVRGASNAGLNAIWINTDKMDNDYEYSINELESVMEIL